MAVTAIWDVRDSVRNVLRYVANRQKTENPGINAYVATFHAVQSVLEYTADEMKTEKRFYVSGVNCDEDIRIAAEQFLRTKKIWRKTGGIVCYHGYQSFRAEEVTPETAHKIGIELAKQLWGERFEVVVATHLNTGKIHNHFVVNSVSFADGLRYYDNKASYRRMRETSDALCRAYGLSVVGHPEGRGRHIGEIKAEEAGRYTLRGQIKRDLDAAISESLSFRTFWNTFERFGYTLEYRGKFLRVRPDESPRFFRLDRLGEGYSENEIHKRINANRLRVRSPFSPNEKPKRGKPKGLYALYLYYQYLLGNLPKTKPKNKEAADILREDRKRMERYSEEAKLLGKYDIHTAGQLSSRTKQISGEYLALAKKRAGLRNRLKHLRDTAVMQPIREEISDLSRQMAQKRREMKLCEDIALRSGAVECVVNQIYETERKEKTER